MAAEAQPAIPSSRVVSLDALRGFDMIWIMGVSSFCRALVDGIKDQHAWALWFWNQFDHTAWNTGFNAWDLIMPLFLFMAGTSMPYAFGKRLARGDTKASIYKKVASRVVLLWILGMMAGGRLLQFDLDTLELYSNTLQSIAAGYLIASIAFLHFSIAGQAILCVAFMLVYWALLAFVPGYDYTATGNFAMHVEQIVMGGFIREGSQYTWVLSSMTFGSTVIMGVLAGHLLKTPKFTPNQKAGYLVGIGVACIIGGQMFGFVDPIIKYIWTSSMTLYSGGWCFLLMGIFYWIIDAKGYRKWAFPFVVVGMNAITIYTITHSFGRTIDAFGKNLAGGLATHFGYFGPAFIELTQFVALWLLLYWMYRQKAFLRV